jgi:hypothetical protein
MRTSWLSVLLLVASAGAALAGVKPGSVGAPGPIAGAGLPLLMIAGGYFMVRRRTRSSN